MEQSGDAKTMASWSTLQARIATIAGEVSRADFRNFRSLSQDDDWQALVAHASHARVGQLLEDARKLVSDMLDACALKGSPSSSLPPAFLSFEETMDKAVSELSRGENCNPVEEVAFLVQMELNQRISRLQRLARGADAMSIIGEADSALRGIRKGLSAIDSAMVSMYGLSPACEFQTVLDESLQVRRAYGKLRHHFLHHERERAPKMDVTSALRKAWARLHALVEGEVASVLRVRDRLAVLDLHARIEAWLAAPFDEQGGQRLWSDLISFVEMLAAVNRRQELIQHDKIALGRWLDAPLDPAERTALLERLRGLDPDLDQGLADVAKGGEEKEAGEAAIAKAMAQLAERYGVRSSV